VRRQAHKIQSNIVSVGTGAPNIHFDVHIHLLNLEGVCSNWNRTLDLVTYNGWVWKSTSAGDYSADFPPSDMTKRLSFCVFGSVLGFFEHFCVMSYSYLFCLFVCMCTQNRCTSGSCAYLPLLETQVLLGLVGERRRNRTHCSMHYLVTVQISSVIQSVAYM
jgi:hypothetical protein